MTWPAGVSWPPCLPSLTRARQEGIMPQKQYTLPSLKKLLQADPKTFKGRPVQWVNEFFLIEALLRSEKAKEAFYKCPQEFTRFFQDHRIHFQDSLAGSHHALLIRPPEEL